MNGEMALVISLLIDKTKPFFYFFVCAKGIQRSSDLKPEPLIEIISYSVLREARGICLNHIRLARLQQVLHCRTFEVRRKSHY